MTCFLTDETPEGICSVFVPTGPNPTSGNIYHLKKEYVHLINVSIEEAMRSIISCGASSQKRIAAFVEKCFSLKKLSVDKKNNFVIMRY